MYSRFHERRHVLFLRGGGIEFQRYDVLDRREHVRGTPRLQAWPVEADVLRALRDCAALTDDGLLPLPVLVSVHLLDVGQTVIEGSPDARHDPHILQTEADVALTPVVLHAWGEPAEEQIKDLFDEMFQVWHRRESPNFYEDGSHVQYDDYGRRIPRQPPESSDDA